jgi:16S rRNA (cytosine1407-C5)-methyltransferase
MNLPESFKRYTSELMGDSLYRRMTAALDEEPPVSVRTNQLKGDKTPIGGEQVGWCPYGHYLSGRPAFTFDPLLHAGCYYVQEASSMFLHHVIKEHVTAPVRMLDLCAAPGGKSTVAVGALPQGSMLFSNEPVGLRAQILAENMMKWGSPNVVVTNSYPADYARSGLLFDVILCDVPCSGEGMFRKDAGAVAEWSVQNVEKCRQLQRTIVADAWQCLTSGGLLVYSTCTFNAHENEENVQWICSELGAEVLTVSVDEGWGITGSLLPGFSKPVYRFIPGMTRGEGLFMAVLRKTGDQQHCQRAAKRKGTKQTKVAAKGMGTQWLANAEDFVTVVNGDSVVALPKALADMYQTACQSLRVIYAGVGLGTVKGRDLVPSQSLALSVSLRHDAFPRVELDYATAISYLRHEAMATLPETTPRGFVLATYGGLPLGFMKNLGNRANNLYPQEWRIKSSHTPTPFSLLTDKQNPTRQ